MARKTPQIGLALDAEMRTQLERLAEAKGVGLAEEIRARIQRTLDQDPYGKPVDTPIHGAEVRLSESVLENEIIFLLKRERREMDRFDEPTLRLAADIRGLAHDVGFSKDVTWHQNSIVHEALVEAVNAWLIALKPSPADDDKEATKQMEERGYDPQSIGKTVAHLLWRRREDRSQREGEQQKQREEQLQKRRGRLEQDMRGQEYLEQQLQKKSKPKK